MRFIDDRYRLVECLGAGSAGTTYRATDQRTSAIVAVKFVDAEAVAARAAAWARVLDRLAAGLGRTPRRSAPTARPSRRRSGSPTSPAPDEAPRKPAPAPPLAPAPTLAVVEPPPAGRWRTSLLLGGGLLAGALLSRAVRALAQ